MQVLVATAAVGPRMSVEMKLVVGCSDRPEGAGRPEPASDRRR
jgi:hypothetical protein